MTRPFPIGAALTVALDALGPPHTDRGPYCELRDLYELLAWLVGDIPTMEQLPGHTHTARAALLAEHPQLADATDPPPTASPDVVVLAWLTGQEQRYGATVNITRNPGISEAL